MLTLYSDETLLHVVCWHCGRTTGLHPFGGSLGYSSMGPDLCTHVRIQAYIWTCAGNQRGGVHGAYSRDLGIRAPFQSVACIVSRVVVVRRLVSYLGSSHYVLGFIFRECMCVWYSRPWLCIHLYLHILELEPYVLRVFGVNFAEIVAPQPGETGSVAWGNLGFPAYLV